MPLENMANHMARHSEFAALLADAWSTRLESLGLGLVQQIVWILLPLSGFALLFHWIEVVVQKRLVQRFGWRAALWTGWIGTPIHEASHVVMCWVFGHEIEAVALFEPDEQEGRLGYVRHSYHRHSWWQETGNWFIGIAPLLGGSVALLLVTWGLYPQWLAALSDAPIFTTAPDTTWTEQAAAFAQRLWSTAVDSVNLLSLRFWLYLYLVLCITLHMAPSASDYRGGIKGGLLLLLAWLAVSLAHALFGLSVSAWFPLLQPLWSVLLTLMSLATVLAIATASVVYAATWAWDQCRRA